MNADERGEMIFIRVCPCLSASYFHVYHYVLASQRRQPGDAGRADLHHGYWGRTLVRT
jgi:hypothetical protein